MSHLNINGVDKPLDHVYVKARTENLWDGAIGLDNTIINMTDGTTTENQNYALSDYIPVSESTSYVYSFRHNQYEQNRISYTVSFYKSNKQLVQDIVPQAIKIEGTISIPFTTPVDTAYIRINWKKTYDDMLMLNAGSTALPYQPYLITKEAWEARTRVILHGLTNPLCGIGTYKDTLDLSTGVLTRYVKKLVFDGTESWSRHTDTGTLVLAISGSDAAYLISGEVTCMCTHYPAQNNVSSYSQMVDKNICMRANSSNIWIRDTDYSESTDFKSYLAQQYANGTPVTVYYILETPETEQITIPSNLTGIVEGYLTQSSTPSPTNPIYPTANGTLEQGGIYSLDTGAYAIAWGRADTFTGTNSISARCYGLPVKSWEIDGNTQQNGVPDPDNPIMPEFVGVRTGNLFDKDSSLIQAGAQFLSNGTIEANSNYSILTMGVGNLEAGNDYTISLERTTQSTSICRVLGYKNGQYVENITAARLDNMPLSFTMRSNWDEIRFSIRNNAPNVMVNLGATALPYEPYGWKLSLTCAGQTQTVYLGQVPTLRRVKKLVLDGTENWGIVGIPTVYGITVEEPAIASYSDQLCSHFVAASKWAEVTENDGYFGISVPQNQLVLHYEAPSGVPAFKSYLATQYANGTPVTVWYVLATTTTGIINEPLAKIGDYADTLTSDQAGITIPTTDGSTTISVDTALAPSKFEVKVHAKPIHFGFKISKSEDDSDNAVIYTHDAVTMTPAFMDYTNGAFNYGSWANAWFVKDSYPVALKFDGTEDFKLDPADYTKKLDGTSSGISYVLQTEQPSDWANRYNQYYTLQGSSYVRNSYSSAPTWTADTFYTLTCTYDDGNFMIAFPKVYFKRYEDASYNYVEISDRKINNDWCAYAHINTNGDEVDYIYLPMFKGSIKSSKLRSVPGALPQGGTTAQQELDAATACGSRWQFWDHSSRELINDLLVLISKSLDGQAKFGKGQESGYDSSDTTTYGKLNTGSLITKGQFFGYNSSYSEVKVFGMEGFWACRWDRVLGLILDNNVWKVKMTPPYNFTGTDFVTLADAPVPASNNWLYQISTSQYGSLPASITTSSKRFKDYFYKNASGTCVGVVGGDCGDGSPCGPRCVIVYNAASGSNWDRGASPIYK